MSRKLIPSVIQESAKEKFLGDKYAAETEALFAFTQMTSGDPTILYLNGDNGVGNRYFTVSEYDRGYGTVYRDWSAPSRYVRMLEMYSQVGSNKMFFNSTSHRFYVKHNWNYVNNCAWVSNYTHYAATDIREDWSPDGGFCMADRIYLRGVNQWNNASITLAGSSGVGGNGTIYLNHSVITSTVTVNGGGSANNTIPNTSPTEYYEGFTHGDGAVTPVRSLGYFRHGQFVESFWDDPNNYKTSTTTHVPIQQSTSRYVKIGRGGSTAPRLWYFYGFAKVRGISGKTRDYYKLFENQYR